MKIIIAQIIGLIAFVIFILSVQQKSKSRVLIFQLIANAFYGIQYLLLNVFTACIMNFISIFRGLVFFKFEKENKKVSPFWLAFLLFSILLVALLTVRTPISIIPIIISILYTVSTYQNNMFFIRLTFTLCAIIWIYYNIKVGAYTAVIGNLFELTSGIISLWRFKNGKVSQSLKK